jgi:hypothetical protein
MKSTKGMTRNLPMQHPLETFYSTLDASAKRRLTKFAWSGGFFFCAVKGSFSREKSDANYRGRRTLASSATKLKSSSLAAN